MKEIKTTRFGTLQVNADHIVQFRDGMIGFNPIKQYVLIESPAMPLVMWLQSVEEPDVAFPLIEPWFFKKDYKTPLTDADKISIKLEATDITKVLVVLTIPENYENMTVNLKAPVILNLQKGLATQTIIQDKSLELRVPAYAAFNDAVNALGQESHDSPQGETLSEDDWTQVLYKKLIETEGEDASSREGKSHGVHL